MRYRSIALAASFALLAGAAGAQTPQGTGFTYQGRLADGGTPANGAFDFQFILYDAAVGGSQVGPIVVRDDVAVSGGLFTVVLDFGASFGANKRWLDIAVRPGAGTGAYTPIVPRQELQSAPSALFSAAAPWTGVAGKPAGFADDTDDDVLGGLVCASNQVPKWSSNTWICAGDAVNPGTVTSIAAGAGLSGGPITSSGTLSVSFGGGGAATTVARSDHNHHGQAWSAPAATGLMVESTATSGTGVLGRATGTTGFNKGVMGEATAIGGVGVYGHALSTASASIGVYGLSDSSQGVGVYAEGGEFGVRGQSANTYGSALFGWQTGTDGLTYGVKGWSMSTFGRGVSGVALATAGSGYGVDGQSAAPLGTGVYGFATASTGQNSGTVGQSNSPEGRGVYGLNLSTSGVTTGVWGESWSTAGRGVFGRALNSGGIGVYGVAQAGGFGVRGDTQGLTGSSVGVQGVTTATGGGKGVWGVTVGTAGTQYGVYGSVQSDVTSYAGYFAGRAHVTGTLSKGAGSFKIDHPLDPANKYLYHSFVESPDMKNVYDGVVTTDDEGYATVTMPDWFEALNRDFRYQLTVLGDGAWARARVSRKMAGGAFVVQTDLPRVEVSWQVTGIRKDPFAERHRIPVEEDKPDDERGTWLHPDAWGQPEESGLDRRRDARQE